MLRSKLLSFITVGIFILIAGCEDVDSEPDIWQPDSMITATDEIGTILSIDENDWGYDGQYEVGDTISIAMPGDGRIPIKYEVLPPYPNPVQIDTINFFYKLPIASQAYLYVFNIEGDTTVFLDNHLSAGIHHIKPDLSSLSDGFYHCVLDFQEIIIEGDILIETAGDSI